MNDDYRNLVDSQAEEIRRLKEDRKNLESRMRLLITNFPLGLIVLNQNQRIEAANDKAIECFQYSAEEMAKLKVNAIFPEIVSVEATGKPIRLMGKRKNGETFAAEVFVNMLGMSEDERLFVSIQDITERFHLEQLKRDLIGMVSHDLRNPLSSVLLTLEMVEDEMFGAISERGHASVARAASVVEYLISLVVNLLDAEKAEQGAIELEYRETSVDAIVKKMMDAISKDDSVMIETDYTNDSIKVDRDRVVQILINLVSNAIKFSPEKSRVRVLAGIEGVHIKFQVIDEGPGIPRDMQGIVFDRYRQLEQISTTKRKGFGLGLAICKSLVEAHKGRIWVESDGKSGSNFSFTIPISPDG